MLYAFVSSRTWPVTLTWKCYRYRTPWYAICAAFLVMSCFGRKKWQPKPRDINNINTGFNMCPGPGPCRMLGSWMTTRDSLTRSALHGNKQMPLRSVSRWFDHVWSCWLMLIVHLEQQHPFLSDLWGLIEDSERGSYFQSTTGSPDAWILIVIWLLMIWAIALKISTWAYHARLRSTRIFEVLTARERYAQIITDWHFIWSLRFCPWIPCSIFCPIYYLFKIGYI